MKSFFFTVDDNIRFLKELTQIRPQSIFDHPYLAMYLRLHRLFGLKVQLNLFYEMPDFTLDRMCEDYKAEFAANAHWLKMSFHSRLENVRPYRESGYDEVYTDCQAVHREILRFAGPSVLADTTTVHYCLATREGLRALTDNGVKGLLGLFGAFEPPRTSYELPMDLAARLRDGEIISYGDFTFSGIDIVLNQYSAEENLAMLSQITHREKINVMIHEQYFYEDYVLYQPDFEQKLTAVFDYLVSRGYESRFFEEVL